MVPKGGLGGKQQNAYIKQHAQGQILLSQTQQQLSQQQNPNRVEQGINYPHPQPWRLTKHGGRFAQLGAMGSHESEIIVAIQLQPQVLNLYDQVTRYQSVGSKLTESGLLNSIREKFYEPLRNQLMGYMKSIVPFDTGRLLNSMELALAGGRGGGGQSSATSQLNNLNPFLVILNTGKVEYAKVVTGMGTNVAHNGNKKSYRVGRIVRQSPHLLNDPSARPDYFQQSVDQGRRFAQNWWNLYVQNILIPILKPVIDYYSNQMSPNDVINALLEVKFS
jgi:hypothetical protein